METFHKFAEDKSSCFLNLGTAELRGRSKLSSQWVRSCVNAVTINAIPFPVIQRRSRQPFFDPRQEQGIFLFSTTSRPALGSTHPPNQRISGILASEVKRSGREADLSSPSTAEVKNGEAIPPLPIHLHVTVLNYLSTRTTLDS
jgi:hypothetical protein